MGIDKLNKTIQTYFVNQQTFTNQNERTSTAFLPTETPYDVSFDGSLFLFSGATQLESASYVQPLDAYGGAYVDIPTIMADENALDFYDEDDNLARYVASKAFITIKNHLRQLVGARDIYVYFDGTKPKNKTVTCKNRSRPFNVRLATPYFEALIRRNLPHVKIVSLSKGEAEHEFFIKRDRSIANVLVTDDTDLYHISYGYLPETDKDIVYFAKRGLCELYRMDKFGETKIPKLLFTILAFIRGSDYTISLFTLSMVESIYAVLLRHRRQQIDVGIVSDIITKIYELCNRFNDDENRYMVLCRTKTNIDDVYDIDTVRTIIRLLLLLLTQIKKHSMSKFVWNTCNSTIRSEEMIMSNLKRKFDHYLKLLVWSVNYSLLGSSYIKYDYSIEWITRIPSLSIFQMILSPLVYGGDSMKQLDENRVFPQNQLQSMVALLNNAQISSEHLEKFIQIQ